MNNTVKIVFGTDNAAFTSEHAPDAKRDEIARVLRNLAEKIERGEPVSKVMDSNGNSIGLVVVS